MTAAQLAHLAELAAEAADYLADTAPALARRFTDAADAAWQVAERQARAERAAELRGAVRALKAVTG